MTTAMILSKNKIIPSVEWNHDRYIKNSSNETVYDILKKNNMNIPL